MVLKYYK